MRGLYTAVYALACLFGLAPHAWSSDGESIRGVWVPTKCDSPNYPPLALAANARGPVLLQIEINGSGHLRAAKTVQGNPLLFQAAMDNLKTCEFIKSAELEGSLCSLPF